MGESIEYLYQTWRCQHPNRSGVQDQIGGAIIQFKIKKSTLCPRGLGRGWDRLGVMCVSSPWLCPPPPTTTHLHLWKVESTTKEDQKEFHFKWKISEKLEEGGSLKEGWSNYYSYPTKFATIPLVRGVNVVSPEKDSESVLCELEGEYKK